MYATLLLSNGTVTVGKRGIVVSCVSVVFFLTGVTAVQAQIVDKPRAVASQRSYWGVLAGATPRWWLPDAWKSIFEDATRLEGRELRIGITRGRPLGYEFGFSYVRKSLTDFLFEREGGLVFFDPTIDQNARGDLVTWTPIETVQIPGIEFHSFIPVGKIGQRVQLGALLGIGAGLVPSTLVRKRIEGPPFFDTTSGGPPLQVQPLTGGYVLDEHGQYFPVVRGQSTAEITESVKEIEAADQLLFLIRAHIAADVLVAPAFKLRFSGGFNHPGVQMFNIEAVYLFGAGRD